MTRQWSCCLTLGLMLALPFSNGRAQTMVHPRDMRMPSPPSPRPDPAVFRHQVGTSTAYVVEDRQAPMVTVRAFVRTGYGGAPDAAVPRAVERALRAGPSSMAPGAFSREVDAMVGEWRVTMGPEVTELSLDVPSEDARRAIALLVATLRGPRFMNVQAGQAPSTLRGATATGGSGPVLYEGSLQLAVDILNEQLLGASAYGGLATTAVTAAAAQTFHAAHFGPSSIVFAVAGDIAAADARAGLAEAVAGWSGGQAALRRPAVTPTPAPARPAGREIHLYDADKLQGWVVMGHTLPPVPLQDRAALEVMNYIIGGGHFDTRLFRELRDKRGLANTGGGYPEWFDRGPGTYTLRTYGRPDVIPFLVELTLREVDKMRTDLVTQDELDIARGALADGVFAMRYADSYATSRSLAEEHARNGDHTESASYQRRVRAVTREQVRDVARRYVDPERFQIVIVGPRDAIGKAKHWESSKPLSSFGRIVSADIR